MMMKRKRARACLTLISSSLMITNAQDCGVCWNNNSREIIQEPTENSYPRNNNGDTDNHFLFPGFDNLNVSGNICSSLNNNKNNNNTLSTLYEEGTPECNELKSLGALCGCQNHQDSCLLCGQRSINNTGTPMLLHPNKTVPIFNELFPSDFVLTCQNMEAYLRSLSQEEGICSSAQLLLSDFCGCVAVLDHDENAAADTAIDIDTAASVDSDSDANTAANVDADANTYNVTDTDSTIDTNVDNTTGTIITNHATNGTTATTTTNSSSSDMKPDNIFQHPQVSLEEHVCTLCPQGKSVDANRTLSSVAGFASCGDLHEGVFELKLSSGSQVCSEIQSLGAGCGCLESDIESSSSAGAGAGASPCSLCRDGSAVLDPEKIIPFLEPSVLGENVTCKMYQNYLQNLQSGDKICTEAQRIGSWCGCPSVPHRCSPCPDPLEKIQSRYLGRELIFVAKKIVEEDQIQLQPTCAFLEASLHQIPSSSPKCWEVQQNTHACGCNNGDWDYIGANTPTRKRLAFWAPIISAFMSLMGSIFILQDILKDRKKINLMYYRITGGAATFDAMSSIAWSFSSLAVPSEKGGYPSGVFNAIGTPETCKAQAFFMQTAIGTLMYSISLAVFYRSVIIWGWREERLKKASIWFHGIPISIGLITAFAGVPFYGPFYGYVSTICSIEIYPRSSHWPQILNLYILPYSLASCMMTYIMLEIYLKVRTDGRRAGRWLDRWRQSRVEERRQDIANNTTAENGIDGSIAQRPSTSTFGSHPVRALREKKKSPVRAINERLEQQVFWQGLSYAISVNSSWPIICIASLVPPNKMPYWFFLFTLILAPSQGFTFSLVYFRPRWVAWSKRCIKKIARRRQAVTEQARMEPIVMLTSHRIIDDIGDSSATGHINRILPSQHSAFSLGLSDQGNRNTNLDQSAGDRSRCSLDPVEACFVIDNSEEREAADRDTTSKLSDYDLVPSNDGSSANYEHTASHHSRLSLGLSVNNMDDSIGFHQVTKQKKYQQRESLSFESDDARHRRDSHEGLKPTSRHRARRDSRDSTSRISSQQSIPEHDVVQQSIGVFGRESFTFGSTSGEDSFAAKMRMCRESYKFDSSDGSIPENAPGEFSHSLGSFVLDSSEGTRMEEGVKRKVPKAVSFRQKYFEPLKTGESWGKSDISECGERKTLGFQRLKMHSKGCEGQDPLGVTKEALRNLFEQRRQQSLGL